MLTGYDVMQVCANGHMITSCARSFPENKKAYCDICGTKTIEACEACQSPIKGFYHVEGFLSTSEPPVPSYCDRCGSPYPWRTATLKNAEAMIRELGLNSEDTDDAIATLPNITSETLTTPSASLKFRRLLTKAGKPAYDVTIGVLTDILSETAKKTLGLA